MEDENNVIHQNEQRNNVNEAGDANNDNNNNGRIPCQQCNKLLKNHRGLQQHLRFCQPVN